MLSAKRRLSRQALPSKKIVRCHRASALPSSCFHLCDFSPLMSPTFSTDSLHELMDALSHRIEILKKIAKLVTAYRGKCFVVFSLFFFVTASVSVN